MLWQPLALVLYANAPAHHINSSSAQCPALPVNSPPPIDGLGPTVLLQPRALEQRVEETHAPAAAHCGCALHS